MVCTTDWNLFSSHSLRSLQRVLEHARSDAKKAVFLITDGYSNSGDPRPAAKQLRRDGVEVFTFGIKNGNYKELHDMASEPKNEHTFILNTFEEFEALARRALHEGNTMRATYQANRRVNAAFGLYSAVNMAQFSM